MLTALREKTDSSIVRWAQIGAKRAGAEMEAEAARLGGNAVVGVDLDYEVLGQGADGAGRDLVPLVGLVDQAGRQHQQHPRGEPVVARAEPGV